MEYATKFNTLSEAADLRQNLDTVAAILSFTYAYINPFIVYFNKVL